MQRQNQSIINAVNPNDTTAIIQQALPNPSSFLYVNPRVDFQLGKSNTLTVRESFSRNVATSNGPGGLSLAEQAFNSSGIPEWVAIGDTVVVNSHLINETRFQWQRIRNSQAPDFLTPTVTVQGAFTTGGSNSGVVQDHQDVFELQNYSTATCGASYDAVRRPSTCDSRCKLFDFGGEWELRLSVDRPLSGGDAGPVSRDNCEQSSGESDSFDAGLFFQDDWRVKPNLTLSAGLRFESQNWISDHADWGPRVAVAWAPGHMGTGPAKTVVRGGYGWFYDRFNVPGSLNSPGATPYVIQTIHQNGINQQSFVVNDPDFYDPNAPVIPRREHRRRGLLFTVLIRTFMLR